MTDAETIIAVPPEVAQTLQEAIEAGTIEDGWLRAFCPYCDERREKRRNLAACGTGFGRHRDQPGWVCHREQCHEAVKDGGGRRVRVRLPSAASGAAPGSDRKKLEKVLEMVEGSQAVQRTHPAYAYIHQRGLRPTRWPPSLRQASLWHREDRAVHPVMLGVIVDAAGKTIGVHRTYLTDDGRKADLEHTKMSFGNIRGGTVWLTPEIGQNVLLAEGIETTLAAAELWPDAGSPMATLSTSGLRNVLLPDQVRRVVIVADNDPASDKHPRGPGVDAADRARERLLAEGRSVEVFKPTDVKDALDLLLTMRGTP